MAKKTFVSKATLKKGERWVIDFHLQHPNNTSTRHRKDFQLNKIEDLDVREQVASVLCNELPSLFALLGAANEGIDSSETVKQAVDAMLEVKSVGPRKKTGSTYRSAAGTLLAFCKEEKIEHMAVTGFTKKWAIRFFDFLRGKKLATVTLKNYSIRMKLLWNAMIVREIVSENPWNAVTLEQQVESKNRRSFTEEERKVVAGYIEQNDYWLFRALLLQYYCYIRPAEISRLRFRDFNLADGTVTVDRNIAKKWKTRVVTIPAAVLHYFRDGDFASVSGNYFVLGKGWKPGTVPANEHSMYKRHKVILSRLVKRGEIASMEGLSWYSWKDTGISVNAHIASMLSTRDQAGHSDLKMTMVYYHADPVNKEYRDLPDTLGAE